MKNLNLVLYISLFLIISVSGFGYSASITDWAQGNYAEDNNRYFPYTFTTNTITLKQTIGIDNQSRVPSLYDINGDSYPDMAIVDSGLLDIYL